MKRYDLNCFDDISEFEDGDYVRYDEAAARIAELEAELRAIKRNRCEHCGAKSSDYPSGCPICGAPQCCEPCCKRQQAEAERDAARTELAAARVNEAADVDRMERAAARIAELTTQLAAADAHTDDLRAELAAVKGACIRPASENAETLETLDELAAFFRKDHAYELENIGTGGSLIAAGKWKRFYTMLENLAHDLRTAHRPAALDSQLAAEKGAQ